jgi:hypothetical protein
MLRIPFNVLAHNYPRRSYVSHDDLFREIGWDDLIKNPAYENTCATRVSLALIKCGVTIPHARLPIKKGPYKHHLIEPGQGKLSHILAASNMFGKPEKFDNSHAHDGIGDRSGIVSFFRLIPGIYEGGHIDIISPVFGALNQCGTDCHWTSAEVWFWPLQ